MHGRNAEFRVRVFGISDDQSTRLFLSGYVKGGALGWIWGLWQRAEVLFDQGLDAVDVDDDGRIRINDPIYLLRWLFAGGPPPPPPFPEAGSDPTEDQLTCWP